MKSVVTETLKQNIVLFIINIINKYMISNTENIKILTDDNEIRMAWEKYFKPYTTLKNL